VAIFLDLIIKLLKLTDVFLNQVEQPINWQTELKTLFLINLLPPSPHELPFKDYNSRRPMF
jgi:hypothetical protein